MHHGSLDDPTLAAYVARHGEPLRALLLEAMVSVYRELPDDPVGAIIEVCKHAHRGSLCGGTGHPHTAERAAVPERSSPSASAEDPFVYPTAKEAEANEEASHGWTMLSWAKTLGTHRVLAAALAGTAVGSDAADALAHLRGLKDREAVARHLRPKAVTEALVDVVWEEVGKLQAAGAATTTVELQEKFSAGGKMLEYGSLNTFFGGLEAMVGTPCANARDAMAAEHTERDDSHAELTTGNYGLTTTSAIEWAFSATPDKPPEKGWPAEKKLCAALVPLPEGQKRRASAAALIESNAQPRTPMPLKEMEVRLKEMANAKLEVLNEPLVSLDEGIGARLYTGPLFIKCAAARTRGQTCPFAQPPPLLAPRRYNGVLRGVQSNVGFLRNAMVQLCCKAELAAQFTSGHTTYEQVRPHVNLYTTTLHVINSAIIKLSKLTNATKVYRGVSGMGLPDAFWTANDYGVKGGIEVRGCVHCQCAPVRSHRARTVCAHRRPSCRRRPTAGSPCSMRRAAARGSCLRFSKVRRCPTRASCTATYRRTARRCAVRARTQAWSTVARTFGGCHSTRTSGRSSLGHSPAWRCSRRASTGRCSLCLSG